MQSIQEIIRKAEDQYVNSTVKLGKYVDWSMYNTIEKTDAYLNSVHVSSVEDSQGRKKPFFNIVTAATNIWYRATDLDRKNIRFIPSKQSSILLAFIANVILQKWMDQARFGQFLNSWGRSLARYGSSVVKFVEQGGELISSVVPWNRFIPDAVDFYSIPRIEKFYRTPAQLKSNKLYYPDAVKALVEAHVTRKNLDKTQKDNQADFIELYEVHGELDSRLLQDEPDLSVEDKDIKYTQQMHVVSFVQGEKDDEYEDFCLYKGREEKDPYMITHLIEEDGRTLSIGAVEHLFNSQWMVNHNMKNIKDTLDIASRLIFQTSDTRYAGKNVLKAIETGDIFIHTEGNPLTRVANDKPDISASQNLITMWMNLGSEITSTPDAIKGNTLPSGTPYSLGSYLGTQANSLFEIMTENKGLAIEEMLKTYIIPYIKKRLNNKDDIVAILDDAGISEIDAIYIPKMAVKMYNKRAADQVLNDELPDTFNQEVEEQKIQEGLSTLGNKRFFKPDEFEEKTWKEVFSDFQWDNIKIEVTNENTDKQAVIQTLASLYSATVQTDPIKANIILSRIMSETGIFSPIEFSSNTSRPQPQPTGAAPTPTVPPVA